MRKRVVILCDSDEQMQEYAFLSEQLCQILGCERITLRRTVGKKVVMVYPIDKWVLMLLEAGAKVRNLGDVKWHAIEDGSQGKGTGRHIACFILDHEAKGVKSESNVIPLPLSEDPAA